MSENDGELVPMRGMDHEDQASREKESCDYGTLSKEERFGDLPKKRLTEKRLS